MSSLLHSYQEWRTRAARLRGPATVSDVSPADRLRWVAVDAVVIMVLLAIATVSFWSWYETSWLWVAALGGGFLGVAIGAFGAWRRLPAWLIAVITTAVYLVMGSFLAMPQLAVGRVVPTLTTLSGLVFGAVGAWKDSLTLDAPIGLTANLMLVPVITMMLCGLLAITISTRSGRPGWGWAPPALALVIGISFGLQTALLPVVLGISFLAVALIWTSYRRDFQRQTLLERGRRYSLRTVGSAFATIAIAGLLAGLLAPTVVPDNRSVLRDVVQPPLDVRQWPSPLQGFRGNIKDHKDDTMITVTGLPAGAAVRLATLDAFDGNTYNASSSVAGAPGGGEYRRIGSKIPDTTQGMAFSYTVTVDNYNGRWIPTIGQTRQLTFTGARASQLTPELYYNKATGTAVSVIGLQSGDTWTAQGVLPMQPTQEEVKRASVTTVELPPATPIPDELVGKAQEWTSGATTDGEAAVMLETELRKGYFSHGLANDVPSLSGHGNYRLAKLFVDHQGRMVGDEEQYAVAMALMARELGMPARVVYGFRTGSNGTVRLIGDNISAWVEINFQGYGWVEFTPTPEKSKALPADNTQAVSKPRPQVENPPPPPTRPENPPPDNTPPLPSERDEDPQLINWAAIIRLALMIGIPLLLLLGPLFTIMALKARRWRRRESRGASIDRISAGWMELVDRARDLGAKPSAHGTRLENAQVVTDSFTQASQVPSTPYTLARQADWATFSAQQPSEEAVAEYWSEVRESRRALLQSRPWWRRALGAVSPVSLRKLRP